MTLFELNKKRAPLFVLNKKPAPLTPVASARGVRVMEMEGRLRTFPTLTVRGISDYIVK
jgi:hypothetical protein